MGHSKSREGARLRRRPGVSSGGAPHALPRGTGEPRVSTGPGANRGGECATVPAHQEGTCILCHSATEASCFRTKALHVSPSPGGSWGSTLPPRLPPRRRCHVSPGHGGVGVAQSSRHWAPGAPDTCGPRPTAFEGPAPHTLPLDWALRGNNTVPLQTMMGTPT